MIEIGARFMLAAAIGTAIAAGVFLGLREWLWLRRRNALDADARNEMRLSLLQIPPNAAASFLLAPAWAVLYVKASSFAWLPVPLHASTVLLAFVAADFSYYWEHRCGHRLRVVWSAYHGVHHTSGACTVATAYRVSFINQFFAPAFYLPWVLLGLEPFLVIAMQLFVFHYQAWVHTEMIGRLPMFDGWLNTPANHRMHHSSAAAHRDCNLGGVLMLWDRLFGTYRLPEDSLRYGVTGQIPPRTLLQVFRQPLDNECCGQGQGSANSSPIDISRE